MPDYQKMYLTLFTRVTDAIEQLQQAQKEAEQQYLESTEAALHLLPERKSSDQK